VDEVPVRPAAHYLMGGVRTDMEGRSSVSGLYAAGESACTGVHGANRLASNSLLEGLVFGARAGKVMRDELRQNHPVKAKDHPANDRTAGDSASGNAEALIQSVQQLMWNKVGIVRSAKGLLEAMEFLTARTNELPPLTSRRNGEARNIHTVAQLITRSALARLESRGAHYRTDHAEHDDARFKKHSIVSEKGVRFA
jgi:L-aspartate oxidase